MKTRKLLVGILLFVALIMSFSFLSKTKATNGLGYLKIIRERVGVEKYQDQTSTSDGPYNVTYKHQLYSNNPSSTKNVWKIVTATETNIIPDLYCLRAGLGFVREPENETIEDVKVLYDQAFDLNEANYLALQKVLYKLNTQEGTDNSENAKITIFKDSEIDNFNSALWLLDHMLLENATEEQLQAYLLTYAPYGEEGVEPQIKRTGYQASDFDENPLMVLSKADIEAIQQLALWYFSNPEDELYHKDNDRAEAILSTLFINMKSNEEFYNTYDNSVTPEEGQEKEYKYSDYASMFDNVRDAEGNAKNYGTKRQEAAVKLYRELIKNAKVSAAEVKAEAAKGEGASKLYEPEREITIYLGAGGSAAEQQPVVQVKEKQADIALRKFITEVESKDGTKTVLDGEDSREPEVDTSKFNRVYENKFQTTAIYNHPKNPIYVEEGDIVTYKIRLYNEGELPAYIKEVTDYLPKWLQIDTNGVNWEVVDPDTNPKVFKTTEYCEIVGAGGLLDFEAMKKDENLLSADGKLLLHNIEIPAATKNSKVDPMQLEKPKDSYILSYVDIEIKCVVMTGTPWEIAQTNIAEVTSMTDKEGTELKDRDSNVENVFIPSNETNIEEEQYRPDYTGGNNEQKPYYDGSNAIQGEKGDKYYPGQQDDDDFDKVEIKKPNVDLALRKFITDVEAKDGTKKEIASREPIVNTNNLKRAGTAIYEHTKEPVPVKEGDIVTYTIRVYNEGEINGRVAQITDYVANYLKYVPSENDEWAEETITNGKDYHAIVSKENCKIVGAGGLLDFEKMKKEGDSLLLKDIIIPAAKENENPKEDGSDKYILSYVDVEIRCRVQATTIKTKITNIAEITIETEENGTPIEADKDSEPGNVEVPPTKKYPSLPNYKDDEIEKTYIPGQQDDDDFEKLLIEPYFDLALRKFITAVGTMGVNNRYPEVSYVDNDFTYTHSKEPVGVKTGDIVEYTIRVYNEGQADGYANEITDDMPEGLEFLPDNKLNQQYRWIMLDEKEEPTEDVTKAKYLITDYLSEQQEKDTQRDNKLKAFDKTAAVSQTNPDYRDVKVAFKVTYVPTTKEESDRIIVNVAQISKDSDDDIDSTPNRDELYKKDADNEDDIDYDNVLVKYFDLALVKWVDQTQVTLNGQTVTTNTGHENDPKNEEPVKLEIAEKDIYKVVIKYRYMLRVTNEGEIAGYATEIKDHIPEGLRFEAADNAEWKWIEAGDGKVTTDYLKDTLLEPGQSAEVPIVLTWINNKDNFGEKVNLAEISKDKNDGDVPDIDSTPDNLKFKPVEDDEDDAPVILALKTGTVHTYIGLIAIIFITFGTGIALIKKYVL